ncbi:MAG: hypothetical protein ACP5N1_01110 [Candidatus Woesearchaeota archaeon]
MDTKKINQENNNLEDKIRDISETCYNTLKESALIVKKYGLDYISGLTTIPYIALAAPTFISEFNRARNKDSEFLEREEESTMHPIYTALEIMTYFVGFVTSISLIADKYQPTMEYISNHPYLLLTPIITNLLSAGYEKQKKNKELKK